VHLILLHRLDDTQVASVNVGIGKAQTAICQRPKREFEDEQGDRGNRGQRRHLASYDAIAIAGATALSDSL